MDYFKALEHDAMLLNIYSLCILANIIDMYNTEAEVQRKILGLN